MGDMTTDFITLTARATQLEEENKRLEARVTELITRRSELQTANSHYVERAREFKAKWQDAEQEVITLEEDRAYWIAESRNWAKEFIELRRKVEEYERKMTKWFYTMRGFGRLGLFLDCLMAFMFFAMAFGVVSPVFQ